MEKNEKDNRLMDYDMVFELYEFTSLTAMHICDYNGAGIII